MKKSVWLVLCVAIIAVILIAVFASQRNSALDQVKEKESQLEEKSLQIEEQKIAIETATQLQRSVQLESEQKVKEAEEAREKAETATVEATERAEALENQVAQQQASIDSAVEQLRSVARQAQATITALTGEEEDAAGKALEEAQQELETLKADYEKVTADLMAAQDQLAALRSAVDSAEAAKLDKTVVRIYNSRGRTVTEFEDLSLLPEKNLAEGVYTLNVLFLNPAGDEIAQYTLPYIVTPQETSVKEESAEPETAEGTADAEPAGEEVADAPAEDTVEVPAEEPVREDEGGSEAA